MHWVFNRNMRHAHIARHLFVKNKGQLFCWASEVEGEPSFKDMMILAYATYAEWMDRMELQSREMDHYFKKYLALYGGPFLADFELYEETIELLYTHKLLSYDATQKQFRVQTKGSPTSLLPTVQFDLRKVSADLMI